MRIVQGRSPELGGHRCKSRARALRNWCALVVLLALFPASAAGGELVLKKAFLKKYKNRATIEVDFSVDRAHAKPNKPEKDGDLHVAGRSPQVGLPLVVELVNAAQPPQKPAMDLIHEKEGKAGGQRKVRLAGAWRLWFEHPGKQQRQGDAVPEAESTNPDHVFEIHPISEVGDGDVLRSFRVVPGYTPYPAEKAFAYYESIKMLLRASKSAVQLTANKAKYNYARFTIELKGKPKKVADGWMVLADVLDEQGGSVVAGPRRMVFVEGTAPADRVKSLGKGDQLEVLGIPRINLERIAYYLSKPIRKDPYPLPYEMIIVGVYP